MKHTTYFTKLAMVIGALSIISIFLLAAECNKSADDKKHLSLAAGTKTPDTKTPELSFALGKPDTNTSIATEETDGGIKKDGKADTKVYYEVPTAGVNGTKFLTLTAKAAKSKGKITYSLMTVKDGKSDKAVLDATGKVEAEGKVTFKTGKVGFFYLVAKIAADGDYKAAEAKTLLLIGTIPVVTTWNEPTDKIGDITGFTATGGEKFTDTITGSTIKATAGKKGNKFTRTVKYDVIIPAEAPKPDFTYTTADDAKVKMADGGDKSGQVELVASGAIVLTAKVALPYSIKLTTYSPEMP